MNNDNTNEIERYIMDTYTEECKKAFTFKQKAEAYKRLPKAFRSEWMDYLLADDEAISFISVMMEMIFEKVVPEERFSEKNDSYKKMYGGEEFNRQMNEMRKANAERAVEILFGNCFSTYEIYFFKDMKDNAYDRITLCGMSWLFDCYKEKADIFIPVKEPKKLIDHEM